MLSIIHRINNAYYCHNMFTNPGRHLPGWSWAAMWVPQCRPAKPEWGWCKFGIQETSSLLVNQRPKPLIFRWFPCTFHKSGFTSCDWRFHVVRLAQRIAFHDSVAMHACRFRTFGIILNHTDWNTSAWSIYTFHHFSLSSLQWWPPQSPIFSLPTLSLWKNTFKTFPPLEVVWHIWVVSFNPSEKYESQLGWWNSQYMEKTCSKPPTKTH